MSNNEPESTLITTPNDPSTAANPAYPDIKSLIRLFFVLLFYIIICGIVTGLLLAVLIGPHVKSPLLDSFLNLLSYVITFLLIIRYAVKKIRQGSPLNFSFNKIEGWIVPVVVICTLALVVGLERVSDLIPMPKSVEKFFENLITKDVFSILTATIAAPILEEILCRGIVLKGLLKNYPPYKAILISAIFFGIIHMNPWQAIPAFFGGLFIGWIFYKTQSIIPGMIIHATNNTTAVLFLFVPRNQQGFSCLLGAPNYVILCLLSVIVFVGGCYIIHKRISTRSPT